VLKDREMPKGTGDLFTKKSPIFESLRGHFSFFLSPKGGFKGPMVSLTLFWRDRKRPILGIEEDIFASLFSFGSYNHVSFRLTESF
jgi:hypothetical protein